MSVTDLFKFFSAVVDVHCHVFFLEKKIVLFSLNLKSTDHTLTTSDSLSELLEKQMKNEQLIITVVFTTQKTEC